MIRIIDYIYVASAAIACTINIYLSFQFCRFVQPQSYVVNKQKILQTTENVAFVVILLTVISMIVKCIQALTPEFIPILAFLSQVLETFVMVSLLCFYIVRLIISFNHSMFAVSKRTLCLLIALIAIYFLLSIAFHLIQFGAFEDIKHSGNVYHYSQLSYDAQLIIVVCKSITFWLIAIFIVLLFCYKLLKLVTVVRTERTVSNSMTINTTITRTTNINLNHQKNSYNIHVNPGYKYTATSNIYIPTGSISRNNFSTVVRDNGKGKFTMTASNIHGLGGITNGTSNINNSNNSNSNNIGNDYCGKLDWNPNEIILLTQITKQTLLVCWFFLICIIYWPPVIVWTFSLIDNKKADNIVHGFLMFTSNVFYVTAAITLWLSFSFAAPKYHIICKCCHIRCLFCCENIATMVLKQNGTTLTNFKQPLLKEENNNM